MLVIGNDAAWGEIRVPQVGIYGPEGEVATRLATSRYDRLTRCSAGTASTSSARTSCAPRSSARSARACPAIVNVMLDPDAMAGHAYRGM